MKNLILFITSITLLSSCSQDKDPVTNLDTYSMTIPQIYEIGVDENGDPDTTFTSKEFHNLRLKEDNTFERIVYTFSENVAEPLISLTAIRQTGVYEKEGNMVSLSIDNAEINDYTAEKGNCLNFDKSSDFEKSEMVIDLSEVVEFYGGKYTYGEGMQHPRAVFNQKYSNGQFRMLICETEEMFMFW